MLLHVYLIRTNTELLSFVLFFIWDKVSLCSLAVLEFFVDQAGPELTEILLSLSPEGYD